MSEKLTVAELLARNGRKEESAEASRPRRRRSLEDGGVSVAELTGSFPAIDADEANADSDKSSTSSSRSSKRGGRTPGKATSHAQAAGSSAQKAAAKTATKKGPEETKSVKPVTERPEERTGQLSAVQGKDQASGSATSDQEPKSGAATFGDVELKQGADAQAKRTAEKKPEPKPESKTEQKAERRTSPTDIRKTTGVVPEPGAAKKAAAAQPSDRETAPQGGKAVAASKVESKPTGSPAKTDDKTAAQAPEKDARAVAAVDKADKAGAVEKADSAKKAAKSKKSEKAEKATKAAAATAGATTAATAATASAESTKTADRADKASAHDADKPEEFHELESTLGEDEVLEYEDDRISWPAMIGQALAAIVVGVGVFFGFSLLWANAPGILVLVLAIAVTLVMVGLVHALLRHSDKLLMVLAFVVGLVLTLGPRFIIGL
ncbi:hypothetical protein LA329_02925 [Corynebacterium falsenii]|uniref:hypothetical protein n=1 Tax=Corynebacterium falsenii TaxID=108486 RepID=UPI001CCD0E69|nr:hypothetical protein [Corynebacterium falsenii]UBI07275.1 hypothetical protein LA329_02925 [Corynebacterium falsenii]